MGLGRLVRNPFKPIQDARDRIHGEIRRGRDRVRDNLPGGSALQNIDEKLSNAARKLEAAKIPGASPDVIDRLTAALKQKLQAGGGVNANPLKFKERAITRVLKEGLKLYEKLVQSHLNKQLALLRSIEFVQRNGDKVRAGGDLKGIKLS